MRVALEGWADDVEVDVSRAADAVGTVAGEIRGRKQMMQAR